MKYVLRLKIGKHLFSNFKVNKGLEQWDAVDPLLFNVVLETLIRRSHVETQGMILDKCSKIMAYADDVVITGRKLQHVEEIFASLFKQTNKMGLEINEKNTEFMIVSQKHYNISEYVKLGTYNLK